MERDSAPWYRQFWPWALMAGPITVVFAGAYTGWLAVSSPDALVVDDYYKEGRAINVSLKRDHAAAELGLRANVRFPGHVGGDIRVEMSSAHELAWPPMIELVLTHPVKADHDQAVELKIAGAQPASAVYLGHVESLEKIAYQITVQDFAKQWRLTSDKRGAAHESVELRAGPPEIKVVDVVASSKSSGSTPSQNADNVSPR